MRLLLRQNIGKSFKPCFACDGPLLIVTGRSVMHSFLIEAGVDLKSLIPIEMSSLFRLFHTFSTPFSFSGFSCFVLEDCSNINFS